MGENKKYVCGWCNHKFMMDVHISNVKGAKAGSTPVHCPKCKNGVKTNSYIK